MEKISHISRIDQPEKSTYGWYVRRRVQGKSYSKFFSDGNHRNHISSYARALKYRNQLMGL